MAEDRQTVTAPEREQARLEQAEPAEPSTRAVDGLEGADGATALLEETETQLRRTLADLDNLRKRYEREVTRERTDERTRVLREWLGVVDNLERALQHASESDGAIVAGLGAVYEQALSVLERLGYPRFDDVGRPFDPTRDEAVATIAADAPKGTVVAVARPGYGSGENILRPAAVIVAKPG
jgi:molecular chaperone GrpE